MYNTLLRKWKNNDLTEEQLDQAVVKGWITEDQANKIRNTPRKG